MELLDRKMKAKIVTPSTRTCPECEEFVLEVSEDENIYVCQICGSIWKRLKPININGKMKNIVEEV